MNQKNQNNSYDPQTVAIVQKDIEFIKEMLKDLKEYFLKTKEDYDRKFVTQDQLRALEEKFKPVKMIAYGIAYGTMGLVLVAVISNIMIKK